jgi:phage N-6-adenine-methyltransferase
VKQARGGSKKGATKKTAITKRGAPQLDVEGARLLLARTNDVEKILEIKDAAKLAAEYHRMRGNGLGAINDALEIVLRAQRRFGEFLNEAVPAKGGRPKDKTGPDGAGLSLAKLKIDRKESARCRKLAKAEPTVFEQHIELVRSKGERLTMSGTIAATSEAPEYDSDEWYTPADRIELVRDVLGEIELDPASCEKAQETVRATTFYSKADDGLAQEWSGKTFINPPYSDPAPWVTKLLEEFAAENVSAAIVLVNNATDTTWCQELLAHSAGACFTKGRIAFLREDAQAVDKARQGQAFFYFGPDVEAFESTFADVGAVLRPA